MTPEERAERSPEAIQKALLEIEQEMQKLSPKLIDAKMKATQYEFELKLLKERKSALQSVLKSLSVL